MANFCTNCGNPNPQNQKFCTNCGYKLFQGSSERPQSQASLKSVENTSSGIDAKYIIIGIVMLIIGLFFVFSQNLGFFSNMKESNEITLEGRWDAIWETSPETFGRIDDVEYFTMNGKFIFHGNSITIIAHGYQGCVFGVDTVKHSQKWKLQNDTLYLVNKTNTKGIEYFIRSKNDNSIELQLMEDIFITLTR